MKIDVNSIPDCSHFDYWVAVDFDGTIADHGFPDAGEPVPGAMEWLRALSSRGVKLVLWTMRSDGVYNGNELQDAVELCRKHGVEFESVNERIDQGEWTLSPKVHADVYIDDKSICTPLRISERTGLPCVDWSIVGPEIVQRILSRFT